MHGATVGSYGWGGSYERGTPVCEREQVRLLQIEPNKGVPEVHHMGSDSSSGVLQGYLAHKKQPPPPLGPP